MSAVEIMRRIDELTVKEQQELWVELTKKVVSRSGGDSKPWLGKQLSFDDACDVVFRENRTLLSALAK